MARAKKKTSGTAEVAVSHQTSQAIEALKTALDKEFGTSYVLHIEAGGQRVAQRYMFDWIRPKVKK